VDELKYEITWKNQLPSSASIWEMTKISEGAKKTTYKVDRFGQWNSEVGFGGVYSPKQAWKIRIYGVKDVNGVSCNEPDLIIDDEW